MKSLKSIFAIILVLTLITAQVGAVCPPAYWNDPNGTCITQSGYLQFISNWTYWNTSAFTSINAANSAMLFQNGTRIMTGSLNAGGYNISNVSIPVVDTDVATKSYVDSKAPSSDTVFSALAGSQDGNITVWNGTSARWLNDSGYTIPSLIAAVPIVNSSYSTVTYVDAVNTSQTNNLTEVNSTIQGQLSGYVSTSNTSYVQTSNTTYIQTGTLNTFKNILINPGFTVNQRVYVSGTNISAGSPGNGYAHDRWRAGTAATNEYTFTQLVSPTQITITAGTLIQTVENANVVGGSYVLSWTGTAQARIGYGTTVSGSLPSGAYAASPIAISNIPAGDYITVEYNAGTLYKPQLESGTVPTKFEFRPYQTELDLCERYFWDPNPYRVTTWWFGPGFGDTTTRIFVYVIFPVPMRTSPTFKIVGTLTAYDVTTSAFSGGATTPSVGSPGNLAMTVQFTYGGAAYTAGHIYFMSCYNSASSITFSAEL
ncbi:MAG: hypothetical protein ABFC78_09710 [Methanoregula sp.]